jgi:Putative zinc ribbon domain
MSTSKPSGPGCQSCGMPMHKPSDFGTLADGSRSEEYCNFCDVGGQFTAPNVTMQEMIDKCVEIVVRDRIMPASQARTVMAETIPGLRRWRW